MEIENALLKSESQVYMHTSWTLGIRHKMYNHLSVGLRKASVHQGQLRETPAFLLICKHLV